MCEKTREELIQGARETAEQYFRSGGYFCSEAVVQTINDMMGKPLPQEAVKMASGFPIGIGRAGCICGAISGGVMALGLKYGRTAPGQAAPDILPISAELHDHIRDQYKSTCCRVIVRDLGEFGGPARKAHCIKITGEVAAWVADKMLEGKTE